MRNMGFTSANAALFNSSYLLYKIVGDTYRQDESYFVEQLLKEFDLSPDQNFRIENKARDLVKILRKERLSEGGLEAFMFQYDLSSEEGIALMCMAEALLRIPDKHTVDKLIRDKLTQGDWESHMGKSHSMFVNAATWALMLTGKVMGEHKSVHERIINQSNTLRKSLLKLAGKGGEPLVRQVVTHAMKILGKQFVMGRNIEEALKRAKSNEVKGYRYSYDMLGEAAYTQEDAEKYFSSYQHAIETIANANTRHDPIEGPGISVKLSALHPRFEFKKRSRIMSELITPVKSLALMAKEANMNFTIDAEEADTLFILHEVFAELAADPKLKNWRGLGLAVQAYQKRAQDVIDWLNKLAMKENQPIMVRLVKGAYWDTEIKLAQMYGLSGYPVFTRKSSTDVNYLHCVRKLLESTDLIYPQFATHNAHTVASVMMMAEDAKRSAYEFQCLHGMGGPLYDQIVSEDDSKTCRIYAPVGTHEDLLAYLVRRLLENGANTSFVNRIVNEDLPISEIIANPILKLKGFKSYSHPNIPLPKDIFADRKSAKGVDLHNPLSLKPVYEEMDKIWATQYHAAPTVITNEEPLEVKSITAPFDHSLKLGSVTMATTEVTMHAMDVAQKAYSSIPSYDMRAKHLNQMAELLEKELASFMALTVLEGGKTLDDAVAEVREAVDFCRYYANETLKHFKPKEMPGPTGEYNELSLSGRGVVACISPWNFPLAIFIGQVSAAYAAGNCVIAKPASQTPLIAQKAIDAFHAVGVMKEHIQLLPGSGSVVGRLLVEDERVQGILLTGSTETAKNINLKLANRKGSIIPFVAETGGQNAMIVDSSALPEQVVQDVITSSFQSAGQRCSALRVLYLQDDIADKIIRMLKGAMEELNVGNPIQLETDVGPVIDSNAKENLTKHIEWLEAHAKKIYETPIHASKGTFVAPCAYEIQSMDQLKQENFGPILHIIPFERNKLDEVIDQINASGYGLTFGIHSRIDETIAHVFERIHVGNMYVNRNMIGAMVGVQPFGGEGLSGTGPKAGGPHYLLRLAKEHTLSINTTASGGNASLMAMAGNQEE